MTRLALLMGLFLSVTVSGLVFLLSMLAKLQLTTVMFRSLVVFFVFGLLGSIFGSLLEILLLTATTDREAEKLRKELELEDPSIERELGDLLPQPKKGKERISSLPIDNSSASNLKPVVIPRMSAESDSVATRGDSAVVS